MLWRVRLFHDDLEKALQAFAQNPALRVVARDISTGASSPVDSIFTAYFNAAVPVTANGRRITGRVLDSGRDPEVIEQHMWWFLVELTAPSPVATLSVRVGLLFEQFGDQRNILSLLKLPGDSRYSLYFVRDDAKAQSVKF